MKITDLGLLIRTNPLPNFVAAQIPTSKIIIDPKDQQRKWIQIYRF